MKVVFFTHPYFLGQQSMRRFASLLYNGMQKRGHDVDLWCPKPMFFSLPCPRPLKKWLGYIDQYIIFPLRISKLLKTCPADTLFVYTDHALGPWVPLIKKRPNIIHCHDFLAQRSALGEIPENKITWTGRIYQNFIRKGYTKGKTFISVSYKTKQDLHRFVSPSQTCSHIVYNGLTQPFAPLNPVVARKWLSNRIKHDLSHGFVMHIGGNHWYKNRSGVLEIYESWRTHYNIRLPLLMIGESPSETLLAKQFRSKYKEDILFLNNKDDEFVRMAYNGASVFLFPSLAEGFGWPIAEAMASGCPVVTTGEAPMTEVAGDAAFLIPKQPKEKCKVEQWAFEGAKKVSEVLALTMEERHQVIVGGLDNAKRFDADFALDQIEEIYKEVLNKSQVT